MTNKILLVVPEAPVRHAPATAERRAIGGKGLRIGTLDNSKSNADHLLALLIGAVKARFPVEAVVSLRKPTPSLPAEASVLERLAAETDVVISAMAD